MKKKRNTKKKKFIWIMAVLLFVVIGIGICRNINDGENYLVSTKNEKSLAEEPSVNVEIGGTATATSISRIYINTARHWLELYNINYR